MMVWYVHGEGLDQWDKMKTIYRWLRHDIRPVLGVIVGILNMEVLLKHAHVEVYDVQNGHEKTVVKKYQHFWIEDWVVI